MKPQPEILFSSRHLWRSNLNRMRTLAALRSAREAKPVRVYEIHNEALARGLEKMEREMKR